MSPDAAARHGHLSVGDGHRIYWQSHGSAAGCPVVLLHGGPGSAASASMGAHFDPDDFHVVQFDQRGCGRSTPDAGDPTVDLGTNTTHHLVADIEALRRDLGIDRWLVYGVSWGSTLALAYAERHPNVVSGLLLAAVTTTRRAEIEWLYHGLAVRFPGAWRRFCAGAGLAPGNVVAATDLIDAYARRLASADAAVRERAALDWHAWEAASLSADGEARPPARWSEPGYRQTRARIVTHYFRHGAWLREGELIAGARRLGGIPGVMVHGALDLAAPLATARALADSWQAELVVVPDAGHAAADGGMAAAVTAAARRLRRRV